MFDRIAAKLSSIVYNDANLFDSDGGYTDLEGWKFLKCSPNEGEHGYFGAAFGINNTVIIAHRGTEIGSFNDIHNDISILYKQPLTQLQYAINFSKYIEDQYKTDYKYIHTGHSLGGLLAEVVGLNLEQKVISFEAPGAYFTASTLLNDITKIKGDNITAYFTNPNFINTHGQHIANKFYKIDYFTNPTGVEMADYIEYSINQHSMDNLYKQFSIETGEPINYEILESWPNGFMDGYKTFLDHKQLWEQKAILDWRSNIIVEDYTDPDTFENTQIAIGEKYDNMEDYVSVLSNQRASALEHTNTCLVVKIAGGLLYLTDGSFQKDVRESFLGKLIHQIKNNLITNDVNSTEVLIVDAEMVSNQSIINSQAEATFNDVAEHYFSDIWNPF